MEEEKERENKRKKSMERRCIGMKKKKRLIW